MHLQESGEMYLETLYILLRTRPAVRSIDIVDYMNLSKPSVSRAVGLLRKGGYITVDDDGHLHLTETGEQVASKIYERHTLLTNFLMALGVDRKTASDDACRMEHVISDKTFDAMKHHAVLKGADYVLEEDYDPGIQQEP